jgi:hypothetical protein
MQAHHSDCSRYDDLQVRRAREVEGFNTDLTFMRRALKQLETQWLMVSDTMSGARTEEQFSKLREDVAAASSVEATRAILESHQQFYPDDMTFMPTTITATATSNTGTRRRSTSSSKGGNASVVVDMVPQVREYTLPVASSAASDPSTRSRLRQNGGLLYNRPVVYRTIKSSGYGPTGKKSLVIPQDINEAASTPHAHATNMPHGVAVLAPGFARLYANEVHTAAEVVPPLVSADTIRMHSLYQPTQQVSAEAVEAAEAAQSAAAQAHAVSDQLHDSTSSHPPHAQQSPFQNVAQRKLTGSALRVPADLPQTSGTPFSQGSKSTPLRSQLDALRDRLENLDSQVDALSRSH